MVEEKIAKNKFHLFVWIIGLMLPPLWIWSELPAKNYPNGKILKNYACCCGVS